MSSRMTKSSASNPKRARFAPLQRQPRPASRPYSPPRLRPCPGDAGHRPPRHRRLPSGAPGGRDRRSACRRRNGLGNHRRQPSKCGHPGRPRAAGLPLHGCRSLRRRYGTPDRRLGAADGSRQQQSRASDRTHGRSGHAHRLADGHREGLLPRAANRRTRRGPSRYRPRPRHIPMRRDQHRGSSWPHWRTGMRQARCPSLFSPATISRPMATP